MVTNIGRLLRDPGDQMQRAESIYSAVLDYRAKVPGPDNCHMNLALERLVELARSPLVFTEETFVPDMLSLLRRVFPQWADYTGEKTVSELIQIGRAKALEIAFTSLRAQAMIISLMFGFGRGCFTDPLYPWIANTVKRADRIPGDADRADRLERKSLLWLERVIERRRQGSRPPTSAA
jgi:hypothetical protein